MPGTPLTPISMHEVDAANHDQQRWVELPRGFNKMCGAARRVFEVSELARRQLQLGQDRVLDVLIEHYDESATHWPFGERNKDVSVGWRQRLKTGDFVDALLRHDEWAECVVRLVTTKAHERVLEAAAAHFRTPSASHSMLSPLHTRAHSDTYGSQNYETMTSIREDGDFYATMILEEEEDADYEEDVGYGVPETLELETSAQLISPQVSSGSGDQVMCVYVHFVGRNNALDRKFNVLKAHEREYIQPRGTRVPDR